MIEQRRQIPSYCFIFLIAFTFISGPLTPSEIESDPSPFLWKARIGESTVFLAGSVHASRPEHFPLDKAYLEALDASDTIILELAEDRESLKKISLEYFENFRVPEEQYLLKHLSPNAKKEMIDLLGESGAKLFEQYEPWVAAIQINSKTIKKAGYDVLLGVDFYLRSLAAEKGKTILGLEKPIEQLSAFRMNIPIKIQIQIVETLLSKLEQGAGKQAELFQHYYDNDQAGLEKCFLSSFDFKDPVSRASYDKLLGKRNQVMVEKLERIALETPGTYLVVVGSGHYFGPENIRKLLTGRGYAVTDY
jgi:uncharacterized protein YbaP (TraB family)